MFIGSLNGKRVGFIFYAMTVLLGIVTENDVLLAADGYSKHPDGRVFTHELKTARINDSLSVGIAGDVHFGNQIMACLLGKPGWFERGDEIDVVRQAEQEGTQRLGLSFHGAVLEIEKCYAHFESGGYILGNDQIATEDKFHCSTLLAGLISGKPYLFEYRENQNSTGYTANHYVAFIPGNGDYDTEAETVLRGETDLDEKVRRIIDLYASGFPSKANSNYTLRRASRGFLLEASYQL